MILLCNVAVEKIILFSIIGIIGIIILILAGICMIRAEKVKKHKIIRSDVRKEEKVNDNRYAESLSQMIKIATVSHKETDSTDFCEEFHNYVEERYPLINGKCEKITVGNGIFYKWNGQSSEKKPLVLMSHYDVVAAKGEWTHPPFSGEISEGKIWGRGSVDTKCSLCAILEAVEYLISIGFTPESDVYILSSSQEEIAGQDAELAANYFKENKITPYLVIDEGGAMLDEPLSGVKGRFAMIAMSERTHLRLVFTAHNDSQGSAMRKINNAVTEMQKMQLSKKSFAPEVVAMFNELTPYMNYGMRIIFANLWLFKPLLLWLLPKISKEAEAMVMTTISFGNASVEETSDNTVSDMSIAATLATTYYNDIEEGLMLIKKCADKHGIKVREISKRITPRPEPIDSNGYKIVASAVKETWADVIPAPFIIFGGTDARHFIGIGDSVIRFAPIYLDKMQFKSFHNTDENINIDTIDGAVDFYINLIKKGNINY